MNGKTFQKIKNATGRQAKQLHQQGYTYHQIGQMLNISEGAAQARVRNWTPDNEAHYVAWTNGADINSPSFSLDAFNNEVKQNDVAEAVAALLDAVSNLVSVLDTTGAGTNPKILVAAKQIVDAL